MYMDNIYEYNKSYIIIVAICEASYCVVGTWYVGNRQKLLRGRGRAPSARELPPVIPRAATSRHPRPARASPVRSLLSLGIIR